MQDAESIRKKARDMLLERMAKWEYALMDTDKVIDAMTAAGLEAQGSPSRHAVGTAMARVLAQAEVEAGF